MRLWYIYVYFFPAYMHSLLQRQDLPPLLYQTVHQSCFSAWAFVSAHTDHIPVQDQSETYKNTYC